MQRVYVGNGTKQIVLDESVFSTLHRGGEGNNVYRMNFLTFMTKAVDSRSYSFFIIVSNFKDADCHSLKSMIL